MMTVGCADYPCKFGSCSSEVNISGYTCTCDQGFSGTNCDILSGILKTKDLLKILN